ncbi:MAG: YceD family protein [Steroidobacteraceae bacterium]
MKQHDVRKLADTRARFEFDIPLADLPGLPDDLRAADAVQVHAQFGREQGWNVVDLQLSTCLQLTCQRCLQPLQWPVDARSRVALVESQEAANAVPEDLEVFLAEEGRCSLAALAGEELLLALPAVALHAEGQRCEAVAEESETVAADEDAAPEEGTTRPFADLAALLKRGKE